MHARVCLQHKQIGSVSVYSSCWVELRSLRRMLWLASPFLCFINCLSGTLLLDPGQRSHFRFILDSRRKRSVWRKRQCFLTISRCLLHVIIFSSTLFAFLQKNASWTLCQSLSAVTQNLEVALSKTLNLQLQGAIFNLISLPSGGGKKLLQYNLPVIRCGQTVTQSLQPRFPVIRQTWLYSHALWVVWGQEKEKKNVDYWLDYSSPALRAYSELKSWLWI